jgi:chromosome segregation ATPase
LDRVGGALPLAIAKLHQTEIDNLIIQIATQRTELPAELSDGDGFLQLEDAANPFAGGLNLVAHPKDKPVQRLSSMSGSEKSLTALSFIFALQRYRPSPFYAFDSDSCRLRN